MLFIRDAMTRIQFMHLDAVTGGHHDRQHAPARAAAPAPADPQNSELWQCVRQADQAIASGRIRPGHYPSCLHLLPKLRPWSQL
jgi:hypothetical protein